VPHNVLYAALAEGRVVRIVNKLMPNIYKTVHYRDIPYLLGLQTTNEEVCDPLNYAISDDLE